MFGLSTAYTSPVQPGEENDDEAVIIWIMIDCSDALLTYVSR